MMFLHEGKKGRVHGTKVGIGTVAVSKMYDWLWETPVDFAAARQAAQTRSFDTWAKEIRRAYPDAAEGVLALERETGKNSTEGVLRRIDAIEKHFADMKAFAQVWLPKSEEIRKMLASYGAPLLTRMRWAFPPSRSRTAYCMPRSCAIATACYRYCSIWGCWRRLPHDWPNTLKIKIAHGRPAFAGLF